MANTARNTGANINEEDYWRRLKAHADPDARDALVRMHLHLVKYVINRLLAGGSADHEVVDYDDLLSAGVLGLIGAVDNFDPQRGVKFVTYAVPRIRGAIIDELRAVDWFPRALRQKVNELYRVYRELEVALGRAPGREDLAQRLGVEQRDVDELMQAASRSAVLSLDEEFGSSEDGGGGSLSDTSSDPNAFDLRDELHRGQAVALVEDAIRDLPEKERLVVTLYYFNEMTLKEIGVALGVTESRVCQIHSQAALRLKSRLLALQQDLAGLM